MTNFEKITKNIEKLKDTNLNKKISYSQFSTYSACKHKFYLKYVLKNYKSDITATLMFGTCLHETIQKYSTLIYFYSLEKANKFDLDGYLYERFVENYKISLDKNNNVNFTTDIELNEFYNDGLNIIHQIKKDADNIFPEHFKHLGNEIELVSKCLDEYTIGFQGFIDDTFYDTIENKIFIYDYKTSKTGWQKSDKDDYKKLAQLRLYKYFISKIFEIDLNDIEIKYIILKRKIYQNTSVPKHFRITDPKHIEVFTPTSGKLKTKESFQLIQDFIELNFNTNGSYKKDLDNTANPSKFNCGFCPFKNNECKFSTE
jgi:hypothetical protein